MVLLLSIVMWKKMFILSTFAAAWNRKKSWDNTTTRNVPERQRGLSYRLYCAHLNEGEQFRFVAAAVCVALLLLQKVKGADEQRFVLGFVNDCATGYLVHRVLFHFMFVLNVDVLRS